MKAFWLELVTFHHIYELPVLSSANFILYKSLVVTVVICCPQPILSCIRAWLEKLSVQDGKPSALVNFASGTVAAVAATLLTQPTDMIRTQMQVLR